MLKNNFEVVLYADGACSGNPGVGGWACVLSHPAKELVLKGSAPFTTNQRMELAAVLAGLRALKRPARVKIVSDSKYVTDGISQWLPIWASRKWSKVANTDFWKPIYELCQTHSVYTEWLKGHSGHPMNERCDRLAVAEIEKLKKNRLLHGLVQRKLWADAAWLAEHEEEIANGWGDR